MPWHLLINKNVNPSFSPQRTCYESRNISKKTIAHTTHHTRNNSKTQYPSLLSTERKIKYTMPFSDQIKENSKLVMILVIKNPTYRTGQKQRFNDLYLPPTEMFKLFKKRSVIQLLQQIRNNNFTVISSLHV